MKGKTIFWIILSCLLCLGSGIFIGRCLLKKGQDVIRYCPEIDLDSLKRTISPDTVLIPDTSKQSIAWVPEAVSLSDTAKVNKLIRDYKAQVVYYSGLVGQLQTGLEEREKAIAEANAAIDRLELLIKKNVYEDSISTATYFYRFRIEAEGPITSHQYGIIPKFPQPPTCPPVKDYFATAILGGQYQDGTIRQIYGIGGGKKWFGAQAAFLPASQKLNLKPAIQICAEARIRFGLRSK